MNFNSEVEAAIARARDVPRADYLRWIRDGDLATRARVYRLSESAWDRIDPRPTMSEHCTFMTDYLLECLLENPISDDFVHSGFEAGHEIAGWLKHLSTIPDATTIIADVAARLAVSYRVSDASTRNRIETGMLEHALESPLLRPFFSDWNHDPILREAYEPALQWGVAHSDKTG